MANESAVFKSADGASVSLPDKTVFLRPGEPHTETDLEVIAKLRSTTGVREVRKPVAGARKRAPRKRAVKSPQSTASKGGSK